MNEPQGNVPQASVASGVGTKPVVLPELFTGEEDFVEWLNHFENVAAINSWGAAGAICRAFWWPLGRRENIQTPTGTFLLARPTERRTELVPNMPYMCQ